MLICHIFPPEIAPGGIMFNELAEDLSAAGHRVTVVTGWPNHPRGVLFEGWRACFRRLEHHPKRFRIVRCGHSIHPTKRIVWRLWYYLTFAVSTFVNGLATGPVDVVLCLSTPIFGSWSAWLLAKCKRARFVYDVFDLHPEGAHGAGLLGKGLAYRLWRGLDTLLCRWSDAIATLGEGMRRQIVDRGVPPGKVTVVPFWVDAGRLRPGDRDNAWRRAQGIPPDPFVALYAGTIGYVSGAGILADVAARLRDRPDVLLLVVGEGVVKDELMREAESRGLTNVRFLPFQPEEVLNDVQATADVGLVTLRPEAGRSSVPSKVLGYLAAGRAVIAGVAEDSDTAEVIRSSGCGVVVPAQDAAALAEAIRRAADDREGTRRMGEAARACLLERYGRQACVALYESLLGGPGSTASGKSRT